MMLTTIMMMMCAHPIKHYQLRNWQITICFLLSFAVDMHVPRVFGLVHVKTEFFVLRIDIKFEIKTIKVILNDCGHLKTVRNA